MKLTLFKTSATCSYGFLGAILGFIPITVYVIAGYVSDNVPLLNLLNGPTQFFVIALVSPLWFLLSAIISALLVLAHERGKLIRTRKHLVLWNIACLPGILLFLMLSFAMISHFIWLIISCSLQASLYNGLASCVDDYITSPR